MRSIFGPHRRPLLEQAAAAVAPVGRDRSADIQRLQEESESLARRKELLLDQLAGAGGDDAGGPETTAEFARGSANGFDALEHQRRAAVAQLEQYRAETSSSTGPGNIELIEALPQLTLRFGQLT
ncbi:hypothetical protein [Streptomyces sp. NPDC059862]|uniref:hypothetical protein n=1 Tax=unclassified Streptomyces TaxID=2593676 RepID=UPI00363185F8